MKGNITMQNGKNRNELPYKYQKSIKVVSINSPHLKKPVEDLELSVRVHHVLKNDNIIYLEDLVQKEERELLRIPNFGRKSMNELKEILRELGLRFGTTIKNYLVINTYNTFDVEPGKVYSRMELQKFLEEKDINFKIIPTEVREIQLVDHLRKL
jgi:hypothetical protein